MKRWGWWLAGIGVLISLAHLYLHDPEKGGFLSCPFRLLTGLLCPGCGSQRAVHDLLHLRIDEAAAHNVLLVLSIPLLGLQFGHARLFPLATPLSARNGVVWGWAVLVVGWAVLRNLPFWAGTGY